MCLQATHASSLHDAFQLGADKAAFTTSQVPYSSHLHLVVLVWCWTIVASKANAMQGAKAAFHHCGARQIVRQPRSSASTWQQTGLPQM